MKNKYYTPDITEFCVGFEYEIHNDPRTEDGWDKEVVEQRDWNSLYCIKEDNDADYRVKYLDREDIESLGWEITEEDKDYLKFEFLNYDLYLWLKYNNEIEIYKSSEEYSTVKNIKIKNKTELLKLMKQLGIC